MKIYSHEVAKISQRLNAEQQRFAAMTQDEIEKWLESNHIVLPKSTKSSREIHWLVEAATRLREVQLYGENSLQMPESALRAHIKFWSNHGCATNVDPTESAHKQRKQHQPQPQPQEREPNKKSNRLGGRLVAVPYEFKNKSSREARVYDIIKAAGDNGIGFDELTQGIKSFCGDKAAQDARWAFYSFESKGRVKWLAPGGQENAKMAIATNHPIRKEKKKMEKGIRSERLRGRLIAVPSEFRNANSREAQIHAIVANKGAAGITYPELLEAVKAIPDAKPEMDAKWSFYSFPKKGRAKLVSEEGKTIEAAAKTEPKAEKKAKPAAEAKAAKPETEKKAKPVSEAKAKPVSEAKAKPEAKAKAKVKDESHRSSKLNGKIVALDYTFKNDKSIEAKVFNLIKSRGEKGVGYQELVDKIAKKIGPENAANHAKWAFYSFEKKGRVRFIQ